LWCGHHVIGTTWSEEKFAVLRALGTDPVAVDVFDAKGLSQVVRSVQLQIIIHQLTDLPMGLAPPRRQPPSSAGMPTFVQKVSGALVGRQIDCQTSQGSSRRDG
jgi:hypothetical protein